MGDHKNTAPHTVRRSLAGLTAVLALGAGSLAVAPTTPAHADGVVQLVHARATRPLGRIARVRAYWTRARMLAAIPVDSATTTATARTSPRTSARTTGLTSNTVQNNTGGVIFPKTVGKLFFSDGGSDYVCSAAAIATRSRNQVLTAGHCAHTGPHPEGGLLGTGLLAGAPRYYSDWVYVPRYSNGNAPLGKWVATHAYVASGWIDDERFQQDQAILTVARLNGRKLVDVTGGNRVALGAGTDHQGVRIWGWPAGSPYDGETAWRCDGPTRASSVAAPGDAAMTCGLNGGASGGPWLLPGRRTINVGTIFAVTSRITTSGPHLILAQPLPISLRTLINRAGG
ncbi:trypsin-like serine peptidase [Nocardioides ultimimeridianus]